MGILTVWPWVLTGLGGLDQSEEEKRPGTDLGAKRPHQKGERRNGRRQAIWPRPVSVKAAIIEVRRSG